MGFNKVLMSCFKDENMIDFFDDVEDDFFEDTDELKIWHAMKETKSNKIQKLFGCWHIDDRRRIIDISIGMSNIADFQRNADEKQKQKNLSITQDQYEIERDSQRIIDKALDIYEKRIEKGEKIWQ